MFRSLLLLILIVGVLVLGLFVFLPRVQMPALTERVTAEEIVASIQQEADTSFVITGYLTVTAVVRSSDTRTLLPSLLDLPLGTSRATVRVPGRVSYGFDLSQLSTRTLRVSGDTVEVEVPSVAIYSAEPDLGRLEVETSSGWLRRPTSTQELERRAIRLLTEALNRQAQAHLASSSQPQVNTGRAIRQMLEPIVTGLGMENPTFRIRLGNGLVLE